MVSAHRTGKFFSLALLASALQSPWVAAPARAAELDLDENCKVSVLNRTVQVDENGQFILPNVPSTMGQVRARATCVRNGETISGQTDYFTVPTNDSVVVGAMKTGDEGPVPVSLNILNATPILLESADATESLTVEADFSDGSTRNVTASDNGTNYSSSSPDVVQVTKGGTLEAQATGSGLITVRKDGGVTVARVTVSTSGDNDGDGLPDDYELSVGLDPTDPVDGAEDQDGDGLSALDEYELGTEPFEADSDGDGIEDKEETEAGENGFVTDPLVADTDGDGVQDGLEVDMGTDPTDPDSVDYSGVLEALTAEPDWAMLFYNTIDSASSLQLDVTGTLTDGSEADFTSRGTIYSSSDLNIVNFGSKSGQIFAGQEGKATVTAENSGYTADSIINVDQFSPISHGFVELDSRANNVAIRDRKAYVATNSGLRIVDYGSPESGYVMGEYETESPAFDVKVGQNGNSVYLALDNGVEVLSVEEPNAPTHQASIAIDSGASDLAVSGDFLHVAASGSGYRVYDLGTPSQPVLDGRIESITAEAVGVDAGLAVLINDVSEVIALDVSDPANPSELGRTEVNGARQVAVKDGHAFLAAHSQEHYASVDFTDPAQPSVTTQPRDFIPFDVAIAGDHAYYADQFFTSAVPIVNLSDLSSPRYQTFIDMSDYGDDDCRGVAANRIYSACTSDNRVYINQQRRRADDAGIAPELSWETPNGDTLVRNRPYRFRVDASDDIAVSAVKFYINGDFHQADANPPYEFIHEIASDADQLSVRAEALDRGGNEASEELRFTTEPMSAIDESWTDTVIDYFEEDLLARSITMDRATFSSEYALTSAGELVVEGSGPSTIDVSELTVEGDLVVDGVGLTLNSAGAVEVLGDVIVRNGGTLTTSQADSDAQATYALDLEVAGKVTVDQSSAIDVSGKGFPPTQVGGPLFSGSDSWGCHGGIRARNTDRGCTYGRYDHARFAGSSAVSGNSGNAAGGGIASITATGMELYGDLRADGQGGDRYYGGGAGGAVHLDVGSLAGMGSVTAHGGRGGDYGGGGGRISLIVDNLSSWSGSAQAEGYTGGAGTVFTKTPSDSYGQLTVDNEGTQAKEYSTPLRQVGEHTITDAMLTQPGEWLVKVEGQPWQPTDRSTGQGLQGLHVLLDSEKENGRRYRIQQNTEGQLIIETEDDLGAYVGRDLVGVHVFDRLRVVNGGWLDLGDDRLTVLETSNSQVADGGTISSSRPSEPLVDLALSSSGNLVSNSPLDLYSIDVEGSGSARLKAPSVTVRNNVRIRGEELSLELADGINVEGDFALESNATLTVPDMEKDPASIHKLAVDVGGGLFVDGTSVIDLNGKGWGDDREYGPQNASACHGGAHSKTTDCEFGRYVKALWAGIGHQSNLGGGYAELQAASMLINGTVRANGIQPGSRNLGASGGGVHIDTPLLSGTGSVEAKGKRGDGNYTRSGGGGRISLSVEDRSGFAGTISAAGGHSEKADGDVGGAGTVYKQAPSQPYGHLVVDNGGYETSQSGSTQIEHVGRHTITNVTDLGNGRWEVSAVPAGGVRVDETNHLDEGDIAYHRFTVGEEQEVTIRVDNSRRRWGMWLHEDTGSFDSTSSVKDWSNQYYADTSHEVTLEPGDYVLSVASCRHVSESEVASGSCSGRRGGMDYRVRIDSPAKWQPTDRSLEQGIQGLMVSLDEPDAQAAQYEIQSNGRSWFEVETSDDLSGVVGQELIGVHTFETIKVTVGASVDFGGDRVEVRDKANSDFSGEMLNVNLTDSALDWFASNLPEGAHLDLDGETDKQNLTVSRTGLSFDDLTVSQDLSVDGGGVTVKGALHVGGTLSLASGSTLKALDGSVSTLSVTESSVTTENLAVSNDMSLESNATVTVPDMDLDPASIHKLALDVGGELFVDGTSVIDLNGKGWGDDREYGPQDAPGCHGGAHSNTTDCEFGRYAKALWAGIGHQSNLGGGYAELQAASMLINGTVRANGIQPGSRNLGASGGGVHIDTPLLSGTGSVEAKGKRGDGNYTRSGGGGRISLSVEDRSGFAGTISAAGGHSEKADGDVGGAGTVYKQAPSEPYGHLVVDNGGYETSQSASTQIEHVGRHEITSVTDLGNGRWEVSTVPETGVRKDEDNHLDEGDIAYHRFTVGEEQEVTIRVNNSRRYWGLWLHKDTGSFDSGSRVKDWRSERYSNKQHSVTLKPGDYVLSVASCYGVGESELSSGSCSGRRGGMDYRASIDSPAKWQPTDRSLEQGIQGLMVSLNESDAQAAQYEVKSNGRSWFEIETSDDLSGVVGQDLIGVHTFETLKVKGKASVDFGGDRVEVRDKVNSDFSGEMLNVNLTDAALDWFASNLPEGAHLDLDDETDKQNLTVSREGLSFDDLSVSQDLSVDGGGVTVNGALDVGGTLSLSNAANLTALKSSSDSLFAVDSKLTTETLNVANDLSLESNATLTVPGMENNPARVHKLDLDVGGELFVDDTSAIDLDNKGWDEGGGSPHGREHTGCYGGARSDSGALGCEIGRFERPRWAGMGNDDNHGGGLGRISANRILLNGRLSSNGTRQGRGDGASGGGLYLDTPELSGMGTIEAQGGIGYYRNNPSGGGGRISLSVEDRSGFSGTLSAAGGVRDESETGGAGTIYKGSQEEPYGHLVVNNGGNQATHAGSTQVEHVGRHAITNVTDLGNGRWEVSTVPDSGVRKDENNQLESGRIAYHRFSVGEEQDVTVRVNNSRDRWGMWLHEDTGSFDSDSRVKDWSTERYSGTKHKVTLPPGDYVLSVSSCYGVNESELGSNECSGNRSAMDYRVRIDSPAKWQPTNRSLEEGIQGLMVSLNEADPQAAQYEVKSNGRSWFELETSDDLSSVVGQDLIGVHTFETLKVTGGASVDFGGDRFKVINEQDSDLSGEILNAN